MKTHFVFAAVLTGLLVGPTVSAAGAAELGELEPGLEATTEFVASSTAGPLASASSLLPMAIDFESERALILQQTNALRAQNGLPPLRLNSALNDIAQDWSVQQARVSTMSHRPSFYQLYPGGWSQAAENVAAGFSPTGVVGAWAGSAGHRANMLSSSTDIGIGIAANSNGRLYYTQNFGRYSSPPPAVPGTVHRIAGADRFHTSALISRGTFASGVHTVYIASGMNFPDALSASAVSGAAGGPLLLVAQDHIPSVVMTELRRLAPQRIIVAGGEPSVGGNVVASLAQITPNVVRLAGANRFETSRLLALEAYQGSGADVVYLATGMGYADALAAGPSAASVSAPVVLVDGRSADLEEELLDMLSVLGTSRVVIVGGFPSVHADIDTELGSRGFVVERIAGTDRFDTAVRLAQRHFPDAERAYVATGVGFADALSGGAAAGAIGAPLFTVFTTCVPSATGSSMFAQQPDDVVMLGGLNTLGPTVAGFYTC